MPSGGVAAFGGSTYPITAEAVTDSSALEWLGTALIGHIVSTYHSPLRDELPRLESMATKVARVHGARASHLARLETIVSQLSAELSLHMRKEELVLFPAMAGSKRIKTGRRCRSRRRSR